MTTKQQRQALLEQDLYDLLRTEFPEFRTRQHIFDVPGFAKALGMSAEGIYKWVRSNRMSPEGAKKVIALSQEHAVPLTSTDLYKFVLG